MLYTKKLKQLHPYVFAGLNDNYLMDHTFKARILPEIAILEAVSEYLGVEVEDVQGQSRNAELVIARHISMYLIKKHSMMSLKSIGSLFGDRDHATVIHACKTVKNRAETDKRYRKRLDMCRNHVLLKLS